MAIRKQRQASRPKQRPRVYIAARYARYKEMQGIAQTLRDAGFEVTSSWIGGNHEPIDKATDEGSHDMACRLIAREDLRDLTRANILLFIGDDPGPYHGGGRWFEMGYAYAMQPDIQICCVGQREILFQYLPAIRMFDTLDDFISENAP